MGISGKFDFEDWCGEKSPDDIINNYNIYAYNNEIIPLRFESGKDLIAYYPYLICIATHNNGKGSVILSKDSFIDSEEKERLLNRLNYTIKYWKNCKRKKAEFKVEDALKKIALSIPSNVDVKIVNRVAKYGDKATIDGLHDEMHERMRREWYQLMIDNGWDKKVAYCWVYGFDRYMESEEFKDV